VALESIGREVWPSPQLPGGSLSTGLAASSLAFDSATDRLAWVGRSPVADTLEAVYFALGNTVTGCDVDMRVESISSGLPSGSLLAANNNAVVTVNAADDNVWKTATLTAGASLTVGQEFALVMGVASGTPNMNVGITPAAIVGPTQSVYPRILQDTGGGTRAVPSAGYGLTWICRFTNAGVVPMGNLCPVRLGTLTTFNSSSNPNERAMSFLRRGPAYRVVGVRVPLFNMAAGAQFTLSLWPAGAVTDAAALSQTTFGASSMISATQDGAGEIWLPTPVTCQGNTRYWAGMRADNANNLDFVTYANADVANALRALPGVSADVYLSTRQWSAGTAGAWTDTLTSYPLMSLIIDQLEGAGSGGMLQGNLRGNMQ
jgi:hypothetical protein